MIDAPTTTHDTLDGLYVTIENRPELAHKGEQFRAFFTRCPNGISATSPVEGWAVEALEEAVRVEQADRADFYRDGA